MKPLTREWIAKADGDFHSLGREMRARKYLNYDAACFHAQQCIEKYLKARLTESDNAFPKTHDLSSLLDLVLPQEPLWLDMRPDLEMLTDCAVEFRYPGESASREQARDAHRACDRIRRRIRDDMRIA
ncbi:MAG: HEPN domain-containing protein [Lentisphaerae bacterium]|nr:HEPN domain-containing protein [Lentisphaerota bacterium]